MNFLPENFKGQYWNLVNNWFDILNLANYQEKPIKYLEIGNSNILLYLIKSYFN